MKINDINELKKIANKVRQNIIEEVYSAQSGHPGGALSIADVLTVLYFNQMNIDENKPEDNLRDRFILSKGHASAALYGVLAEKGYFEKEKLKTFRKIDSNLQGHPDVNKVSGVDMTTGSLGQGLSIANGMAIASKMDSLGCRIYVAIGDGECEEGQIWEAALTANKYHLDNLCVILDYNNLQIDGSIEEVKGLDLLEAKWDSFGFNVIRCNGNDIERLIDSFNRARNYKGKPSIIIANTVKGKGVSFMENKVEWHGKAPNEEEYRLALEELKKEEERLNNI